MEKFKKYLENPCKYMEIALTDNSYKKVYQKENSCKYDKEVNTQLATLGDAILKVALCEILYESNEEKITEKKKEYESDKVLVEKIGAYYDILKYLKYDKSDEKKPKNYNYTKNHKYIATAVEACIGAIYLDNKKSNSKVKTIVKSWKKYIDKNNNGGD